VNSIPMTGTWSTLSPLMWNIMGSRINQRARIIDSMTDDGPHPEQHLHIKLCMY